METTKSPKELYAEWCATQNDLPLFMQPWWLDAVCAGKEWNVILYQNETTGKVLGAMPYLLRKKLGMKYVVLPQLTQICGLRLDKSLKNDDGSVWDRAEMKKICAYMAEKLQEMGLCYYYQQFPVDSPVIEEMAALGFKTKKRVTYRIEDLSNLDKVIEEFSKNKKRQLQKALSLHAERGLNPEDFYRFHSECMTARKKVITYSRELLLLLERKTTRLGQGEIVCIKNADGVPYAAAFVAWDNQRMYYLMPCYAEAYKDSGAGALLVLECIKLAREKGVAFDFEGSMHRGIANHYKQFGSAATEYYSVSKLYKWWFWFALAYNWVRNLKYRI